MSYVNTDEQPKPKCASLSHPDVVNLVNVAGRIRKSLALARDDELPMIAQASCEQIDAALAAIGRADPVVSSLLRPED